MTLCGRDVKEQFLDINLEIGEVHDVKDFCYHGSKIVEVKNKRSKKDKNLVLFSLAKKLS